MENVKTFLNEFFKIEAEAKYTAHLNENLDEINTKIKEMYDFCSKELYNHLGVLVSESLKPKLPSFIPQVKREVEHFKSRHLFKLSEYENVKYGKVYVAYCSLENPMEYLDINELFIVTKISTNLKIVKNYIHEGEDVEWLENEGVKDLSIKNLGVFIETLRLKEPINNKEAMILYNKDN